MAGVETEAWDAVAAPETTAAAVRGTNEAFELGFALVPVAVLALAIVLGLGLEFEHGSELACLRKTRRKSSEVSRDPSLALPCYLPLVRVCCCSPSCALVRP